MEGFGKLSNIITFKDRGCTGYDESEVLGFCVLILLLFSVGGDINMKNQCLLEFIGSINVLSLTL